MRADRAKQLLKNGVYRAIGETVAGAGGLDGEAERTLRVLMYHKVNDLLPNASTVPTEVFTEQMELLGQLGYVVVSLEQVRDHYVHGAALPEGAIGFGFEGARFTNSESRVTFEQMLAQFGMAAHAALARIGSIVHFLEVRGMPVPEAAGVQTLLQGAVRRAASDDELLREAEKTFDLLYEAYSDTREVTRG